MGEPWGIGGFRGGGGKPTIKQIVKKKNGEIGKKSEKSDFFLLKMV